DLRARRRAVAVDRHLEHRAQRRRGLGRHDAAPYGGSIDAHHRQRHQLAAAREDALGTPEPHPRHRDAVPPGHPPPLAPTPSPPPEKPAPGPRRNPTSRTTPPTPPAGGPGAIFAAPTFDVFWMPCATVSGRSTCASRIAAPPMLSVPGAVWIPDSGLTLPAS